MSKSSVLLLLCLFLLVGCKPTPIQESESDFAILAQAAEGFAQAGPDTKLTFPRDHGAHPDFRIEWWYLTANLEGADGHVYGVQWTLFRSAVRPPGSLKMDNPWQSEQVYMAHFAVTGPNGHQAFQRYSRGGKHGEATRAGTQVEPFSAWLDDWSLTSTGPDWLPIEVNAKQGNYAVRLDLQTDQSLLLQGIDGFSQKHPNGGGSHYYSQPFLKASGKLIVAGQTVEVSGQAWLDREWSSQFLQPDQEGWDWFALHLDSGEKLMLFRLRSLHQGDGATGTFHHGALISPDGSKKSLNPEQIEFVETRYEPVAGRQLPLEWQINLPEIGRSITVEALHSDQWMDVDFPYWEGVVTVNGSKPGSRGVGYLEMTGYTRQN